MGVFKLQEMNSKQCEKAITLELCRGNDEVQVDVDVKNKTVRVENLKDDRVIFLLKEIGYNPIKVQKTN